VLVEEGIRGWGDHVDQGVSDAHDIELGGAGGSALIVVHGHVRARYRVDKQLQGTRSARYARVVSVFEAPNAVVDPHRLPRHVVPSRYDVTLEPDLAAATFAGTIEIAVSVSEGCSQLILNAIELEITTCTFDGEPAAFELVEGSERLFVTPPNGASPGDHTLVFTFTGTLNDQLRGWYRSTYRDDAGDERVIAATQMQATDCRRGFPCWDEPDFKAVFAITLVVDPDLMAVSNGSEASRTTRSDGKVAIRFNDTMVMSTYLVAFVVGPLEATDWLDVDGVPIRIVHVPGKRGLTEFGLDVAAFSLRWFQNYYGIPYPSDKVDLLALPDFAAGAMENVGCITFRENLLLVDESTATQNERELVADVVAHELAHMWFGDLVTMDWWNGIWLNEAFATFMEIAACDAYQPSWERWTTFGLERSAAFETDSLSSTRSVEYPVYSPSDCEGMFDVLTYQKGGALLRMLEQYLGVEQFRAGVSHYLRTNAYGNTKTSDLWDAIEHTSGEPVRQIMDSWIWQPGYPLVSIRSDGSQLVIGQRRFSFEPEDASAALWSIPIRIRQGARTSSVLLTGDEMRVDDIGGAVIVNAGGHGFYRVDYSEGLQARLTGEIVAEMTTLERYNLVDDAWNAVVAGALAATDFVDLVDHFGDEREYGVWASMAAGLKGVRRMIAHDADAIEGFQRRVGALVRGPLAALGEPVEGESELTGKARGLLLSMAAMQAGDLDAQARGRDYYARWVADHASVDAEIAAAATTIVAATGGIDEYERMLERAMHGHTPQERLRHLFALAEFDDPDLMTRTCDLAMSGDVKSQDAPFLLRAAIVNRKLGDQAWGFVRRNWTEINEKFPRNTIVRMVEPVKLLDRPTDVADVQSFFSEHPIPQGAKTLQQILERQRVNAANRTRNADDLIAQFGE
jgi:puromycin-sensitive aminopeptidase